MSAKKLLGNKEKGAFDIFRYAEIEKWLSLGNLTYASYLIHFPIQLSFMIYFNSKNEAAPYQNPYFLFVYIGVTLILAWFIFNYYEKPSQHYIRKILHTKSY